LCQCVMSQRNWPASMTLALDEIDEAFVTEETAYFERGSSILYQEVDEKGRIIDVKPVTVVEDLVDRLVVWLPIDTPCKRGVRLNDEPGPRHWKDGAIEDSVWKWAEILIIMYPDEARETWVKWSSERVFQGWHVNIQSKLDTFRIRSHRS
jgi:hypothetical protein